MSSQKDRKNTKMMAQTARLQTVTQKISKLPASMAGKATPQRVTNPMQQANKLLPPMQTPNGQSDDDSFDNILLSDASAPQLA